MRFLRNPMCLWLVLSVATIAPVMSASDLQESESPTFDPIPIAFEPNHGQSDSTAAFISTNGTETLLLSASQAVVLKSVSAVPSRVTLELLGANRDAKAEARDLLPGRSNYYIGNEASFWHEDVPQFQQVAFHSVYPGIDLVYYGNQQRLEYDFLISPGASVGQIQFKMRGANRTRLTEASDIVVDSEAGSLQLRLPSVYQVINGAKKLVSCRFVLRADNVITFRIGQYDQARALVIDPVLSYASLISSSSLELPKGIGVDSVGNAYVLRNESGSVVIQKLSGSGSKDLYTTRLGGNSNSVGTAIAVDALGHAYVTGTTSATDFPTTPSAYSQICPEFCNSAFVTKLSSDGSIDFSTYMGGNNPSSAIAIDSEGSSYITGSLGDALPLVNAFQDEPGGTFVQKLNSAGSSLVYSTYFGTGSIWGRGIAVDLNGSAYLTGIINGGGIPLKSPIQQSIVTGFLSKLSPDGRSLVFSTYLGGGTDTPTGLAVDPFGNAHVVGYTSSCSFPLNLDSISVECANAFEDPRVFVAVMDSAGAQLLFSTLLPGSYDPAIAVDKKGFTYVVGTTLSDKYPLLKPISVPIQSNSKAFVSKIDLSGKLVFSSYLGGPGTSQASAIAVSATGAMFLTGVSTPDFPVLHPVPGQVSPFFPPTFHFIAKVTAADAPQISLSPRTSPFVNLQNVGSLPLTITSITTSSNFTQGGNCKSELTGGESCDLVLTGAADNKKSGTVTIISNAKPASQTVLITKSASGDVVGSNVTVFPQFLRFAPQLIGTKSPSQAVFVKNSGNQPAAINSIFLTSTGPFSKTHNCPAMLQPGSTCTISVIYNATSALDNVQLGIVHDPGQTRETVFIGGIGSSSAIFPSTQLLEFGQQFTAKTSLSRVVNLINTTPYSAAVTSVSSSSGFSQTNSCNVTIPPHGSCRVAVTFSPSINQNVSGTLTAANLGPGGSQTIQLFGTGFIDSELTALPRFLDMFSVINGFNDTQQIILTNSSQHVLQLQGFSVLPPFFQTNNCPASLAAGSTCNVNVSFKPTQAGTISSTLTVRHSGLGSPQVFALTGSARTALIVLPDAIDFGQQQLLSSVPNFVSIGNGGGFPSITVSSIKVQGTDFRLVSNNCPQVIDPFVGCGAIKLSFKPTQTGLRTGTVTIIASDLSTPHVVPLQGVGIGSGIEKLSSIKLDYGIKAVGTKTAKTVKVTNAGTAPLKITGINSSVDQFTQSNNCTVPLAVGVSCSITVRFAPTIPGMLTGTLRVNDDGAGSPHLISLSGIAQ